MRVVLSPFGSHGDIRPFLALTTELQLHGHQPILALSPDAAESVERYPLDVVSIGPDVRKTFYDRLKLDAKMFATPDALDDLMVERARSLNGVYAAALPRVFDELRDVCQGADVLITARGPVGRLIYETTGIPFVSVYYTNLWTRGSLASRRMEAVPINAFRSRLGLPQLRDPMSKDAESTQLVLRAVSRYVYPAPSTQPAHYQTPGFFFLNEDDWQPAPELVDFLAAGEPPIVFTFSSVIHDEPDIMTDLLIDAIRRVGRRAIIQQGWSGLAKRTMPPGVYSVGFVPHHWLFSQAACIVHHGGVGTMASAFRVGVPSVVVPHIYDQFLWAEFVKDLGCGGPPIPFQEITAERLSMAITHTLGAEQYHRAAITLRDQMQTEQGVKTARKSIEQVVERGPTLT